MPYEPPSQSGAKIGCGCATIFAFVAFASLLAQSCAAGQCESSGGSDCPWEPGPTVWLILPIGFAIVWAFNAVWEKLQDDADK
ncbi:hypothetical protein [Sphingomonas spermidinifaciens]|uniref:hypothetical protein n=1 Tax=Sphingomonas spermidinifaciens TaxID=1141889 RepID=UPI001142BCC2|nr:hypothetical protein [Sphingomonas spermidinifaciens]